MCYVKKDVRWLSVPFAFAHKLYDEHVSVYVFVCWQGEYTHTMFVLGSELISRVCFFQPSEILLGLTLHSLLLLVYCVRPLAMWLCEVEPWWFTVQEDSLE